MTDFLKESNQAKTIKYLGINLTKGVKDLYSKSTRHCWKKSKKTQINGKVSSTREL